ncbi:MAG TPA: hypothetical protein VHB77_04810, partial [Planctomycetaceae bacterium]|nr:hypothetical protein [Planctomycetaceae bacterium]
MALALIGLGLACGLGSRIILQPPPAARVKQAAIEFCREEYARAWELALAEIQLHPNSATALRLAAEAAARLGNTADALRLARRAVQAGDRQALFLCGDRAILLGHARLAESCLREYLALDPHHIDSHLRLAYLLEAEGRTWEARPSLWHMLRSGRFRPEYVIMAGAREWIFIRDPRFQEICAEAEPDDPLPLLGPARRMLVANDAAGARAIFERIVARDPDQSEAQARLGRILLDTDPGQFPAWNERLPPNADQHPEIWLNRGLWAQAHGQPAAAARCFWQALRLDPDDRASSYHLPQVLKAVDPLARPEPFAEHAREIGRLELLMADLRGDPVPELMRNTVERLDRMGRKLEAAAWARVAQANVLADTAWAAAYLRRLSASRQALLELRRFSPDVTGGLDLSQQPLPDFNAGAKSTAPSDLSATAAAHVRFEEEPEALDFRYFNGADPRAG